MAHYFPMILLHCKEIFFLKINYLSYLSYGLFPLLMFAASSSIFPDMPSMSLYYLSIFITSQLVNGWTSTVVATEIMTGKIGNRLLYPVNYRLQHALFRVASVMTVIPVIAVVIIPLILLGKMPEFASENLPIWFLSIIISIVIQFQISMILGWITTWSERSRNVTMLWFSLLQILSGVMFPLSYFPKAILEALFYTPFPYFFYIPTVILIEGDHHLLLPQLICLGDV
ncbi:ABC-2 family transporter protein [Photobacterium sp. GJ3]|uniref:ABC-2 family transporter protein n=1 Tax=Photobacterium sp. GJ3 TaxID=2829502 RepID=UPI001B8C88CD|nr:ABC-2 family transporter protein [Photobacterium sp. GJ3]QUJ67326.1 ABC-2 family transporter protein [Photobacterium sp. GJ3]